MTTGPTIQKVENFCFRLHFNCFISLKNKFFLMLVASFSGLYCSITHLHVLSMSTRITYEYTTGIVFIEPLRYSSRIVPSVVVSTGILCSCILRVYVTHITHIQDVHNIAGLLVPYNHARPKRGLIH